MAATDSSASSAVGLLRSLGSTAGAGGSAAARPVGRSSGVGPVVTGAASADRRTGPSAGAASAGSNPGSGAAAARPRQVQAGPLQCRPESREDYLKRLGSFRPYLWFGKPLGISPINAARRGWECIGRDVAKCNSCSKEMRIECHKFKWVVNTKEFSMFCDGSDESTLRYNQICEALLTKVHNGSCPWKGQISSPGDPGTISDAGLAEDAERRLKRLGDGLVHCPVLVKGSRHEGGTLETLAIAGWELVPGGTDDPRGALELLRCTWCQRVVAVQAFLHRLVSAGEVDGDVADEPVAEAMRQEDEPVAEASRKRAQECVDEASEAPRKRGRCTPPADTTDAVAQESARPQVLPPLPGLYTPLARGRQECTFDPYGCHRFYCPIYSQQHGVRSRLAVRTARCVAMAREEAAAASSAAAAEDVKAEVPNEKCVEGHAEEIICLLSDVMPPGKSELPRLFAVDTPALASPSLGPQGPASPPVDVSAPPPA